jgi:hypothetical protein
MYRSGVRVTHPAPNSKPLNRHRFRGFFYLQAEAPTPCSLVDRAEHKLVILPFRELIIQRNNNAILGPVGIFYATEIN